VIVAGFDEAGYGPKLGPLVVGYSALVVEGHTGPAPDLWDLLPGAVRREGRGDAAKVWVADSKQIKPRKNGVKQLELGVLSFLASAGELPTTLPELLERVGQASGGYGAIDWYQELAGQTVPAYAWPGEVSARAARIRADGERSGVRFLGAGARALPASHLNERFAVTQNKAAVLSETFVELLRELRGLADGPLHVTCDKHGGRSNYARLLGAAFPMCPIDIDRESGKLSVYRVRTPQGPMVIGFAQEAEQASLPTALASMLCKYLREVFMDHFNAWFQGHLPGLKKTAGYALDAKRFLHEVEDSLPQLGVSLDTLVRAR
jgi:hypothetical protein